MRRATWVVAALLAAGLAFSAGLRATADDLIPAPWRDQPNTTFQEATFSQPWDVSWETVANPFGDPDIWMYGDIWQWDEEAEGRSGVVSWDDSGNAFSMDIPNSQEPNREKRIWVQVTYFRAGPTIWEAYGMGAGGGSWGPGLPPLEGSVDHGDGWITEAREMVLEPNPPGEFVGVHWEGVGMVDQVVVETICVPEPGTLAMVLGGLALLCAGTLRRRRTAQAP